MVTLSQPLRAARAVAYYREHCADGAGLSGAWWGQAAIRLGLQGPIFDTDLSRVLAGRHPRTGALLIPPARGRHRAGWDATWSAPKSVSVMALVGEDSRLRRAHHSAMLAGLAALEPAAATRAHGGRTLVATGSLCVALCPDETNRALDPQLHTHAVIVNLTPRPDGRWRALESRALYQAKRQATATYRAALADALRGLGYEVRSGRTGAPEIAGIPEATLTAFSTRRRRIQDELDRRITALAVRGVPEADARVRLLSGGGRQRVTHQTRAAKPYSGSGRTLLARWQARAIETGAELAALRETACARATERGPERPAAHEERER